MDYYKDEVLDRLASFGNVAQFVSFGPDLQQRFARVAGLEPNHRFGDALHALGELIERSPERRVNIRTFAPGKSQGNEFVYSLDGPGAVLSKLTDFGNRGFFTIVNETVDVNDGGVSGVVLGDVIEFSPGGTPRVVDNAHVASMSRRAGLEMLERVYGFVPELGFGPGYRVEFSIHPVRRGWQRRHTIIWECQEMPYQATIPTPNWPNDFSEFLGDKVFGLLVALSVGCKVPRTCVLSRRLAPFSFGEETGSDIKWVRTCPRFPAPGRFATMRGWVDPFRLLASEDPAGTEIPSLLVQDEVTAEYSGALLTDSGGKAIIEGVPGYGDSLMIGTEGPVSLPGSLVEELNWLHRCLVSEFGAVRLEWVHDGNRVWALQLQQELARSSGALIVDGRFDSEVEFRTDEGIESLRRLVSSLQGTNTAIRLVGNIGMTSHMADILRRAGIPSRLVRPSMSVGKGAA